MLKLALLARRAGKAEMRTHDVEECHTRAKNGSEAKSKST